METSDIHWYAFRIFRNGRKKILSIFEEEGIRCFIPERMERRTDEYYADVEEKKLLFPTLLFGRCTQERAKRLRQEEFGIVSPYTEVGTTEPAAIPDREMEIFMMVVTSGGEQLEAFDEALVQGDKVRVLEGVFKGAEGYIVRIKGTKKFVVSISGVTAVATCFIPRRMLEKIA